jgi:acyl-CoA thioesterase
MSRQPAKNPAMDVLLETLDLERLESRLFRGKSPQVGWQRVFGGQVIGGALRAFAACLFRAAGRSRRADHLRRGKHP